MSDIKALAGVCSGEFHKLLRCGAGGRNHGSCCSRRGVPPACLSLCSGVIVDSPLVTATSCVPFIGNIVQCFEEGKLLSRSFIKICLNLFYHLGTGLLPGPISELHVIAVSNSSVTLKWEPPADSSNVTDYVIHYQKVDNTSIHETLLKLDNVSSIFKILFYI